MSFLRHLLLLFRPRHLSSPLPVPPERPRARLRLEELETRALPSASSLSAAVAHPGLQATPLAAAGIASYTPAQIRHAYGFDQVPYDGSGQTIAIVDAYDDPNIASDLAQFDSRFGLPSPPSFTKVRIGSPAVVSSWADEISLDVEWAHAIAPGANILLVEASSNFVDDLLTAVDYAREQPGVVAVSMSWYSDEFMNAASYDYHFTTPAGHPGITFVACAGDRGAAGGPEWPAVSPNVLAVGGTSLTLSSKGAYAQETGWSAGGGGTSLSEPEPAFQRGVQTTGWRDSPDVAYDADPNTGFLIYDSVPNSSGRPGWFDYGGTSAGAPQWAGLLALADQGRAQLGLGPLANGQAALYSLPASDFRDVTAGNNGFAATTGYDLVTGRGTPNAPLVINDLLGAGGGNAVTSTGARNAANAVEPAAVSSADGTGEAAGVALAMTEAGPKPVAPQAPATAPAGQGISDAFWISQEGNLGLSAWPTDGTDSTRTTAPAGGSQEGGHDECQVSDRGLADDDTDAAV
jgi:subtilase family serine protease